MIRSEVKQSDHSVYLDRKRVQPVVAPFTGKRVRGIEPPLQAWEAGVLPLNYTRNMDTYDGREDRIRTCDPHVPNVVLYQAEPLPVDCSCIRHEHTSDIIKYITYTYKNPTVIMNKIVGRMLVMVMYTMVIRQALEDQDDEQE